MPTDDDSLRGRLALVTGSSRGIGAAVATALAERGAHVVLNSARSRDAGEALATDLAERFATETSYVQADVTDERQIDDLFTEVAAIFGRHPSILVANAGAASPDRSGASYWIDAYRLNFLGAVLCSERAHPWMSAGDVIIHTTSVRGHPDHGRPGLMAYSAARAALTSYGRTLAKQLAPRRIRVCAVAPGFTATSYLSTVPEDQRNQWIESIPLRTWIEAESLADAYLLAVTNRFITGTTITVDAGFSLGTR